MGKKLPNLNLNTYDNLFSNEEQRQSQEGERIVNVSIKELHNFKEHPFQIRMDEEMVKLVESVKENGVLSPILVRPRNDGEGYEIVAGHRRKTACSLSGITEVPSVVRELSDEQAIILMVDSNIQRENILPSERGFAYKMKLDAMKRQGKRNDLTSGQLVEKLNGKVSVDILGEDRGLSGRQVNRFIRITYLIPELIEYVDGIREDNKKIAFNPAVELSYLSDEQQYFVLDSIDELDSTPSLSQSQRMKELSKLGKLGEDAIYAIMTEQKPNQKDKISFKSEEVDKYFPKNYTPRQKTETIVKLLDEWAKKRKRDQALNLDIQIRLLG